MRMTAGLGNDAIGTAIRHVEANGLGNVVRDAVAADVDKHFERIKTPAPEPEPAPTGRIRRLRGLVIRRT